MEWLLIAPIAGAISILAAVYLYFYVSRQNSGNERMREISGAIKEGANAYLKRQYLTLAIFVIIVAIVLLVAFWNLQGPARAFAYVLGSVCSGLAGYFGMNVALKANSRTANAARSGLDKAFPTAFYGGAVMGLSVVGLALIGISGLYYIFREPNIVLSFSLGASSMALFAKAGGGIYTKTADIGADLVGKVEIGIPEDDPRNPAVIADNVGDNVGDVAGMGADLFDSYVASIVAAMMLGATSMLMSLSETLTPGQKFSFVILPLLLAGMGIFASLGGMLFMKIGIKSNPGAALNRGTYITCIMFAVFAYFMVSQLGMNIGIFYATLAGLIAGMVIGMTTDFFTSIDRTPVKKTAESAKTGAAITILSGFSYGIISIVPPIIGICAATIAAWNLSSIGLEGILPETIMQTQVYGVAVSAVGMLSIVGMIVSADAYGPIVDNAKGIAEQAGIEKEFVDVADKLDAAGNTAKAITKGFAIGAAALTVIALFVAYKETIEEVTHTALVLDLMNPNMIGGIFLGAMMPPLISALLILGVGRNAFRMVEEIRRQFKEIPGLLAGKGRPDYAKCVDIAAKGALKELVLPSVLAMVMPIVVGFLLGKEALAGFLAGSIVTGIIFALFMANSGGTWDNAKKYIEAGGFGGEGSDAHKAAVVGDTVGDPFKDTAGPSLNTMITVMSLVASVFAPIIIALTS